ncbi:MAG: hypothetical protein PVJ53_13675 [Desulfobacterales bacterium]
MAEFGDIALAQRSVRLPEVLTGKEVRRRMTNLILGFNLMAGLV